MPWAIAEMFYPNATINTDDSGNFLTLIGSLLMGLTGWSWSLTFAVAYPAWMKGLYMLLHGLFMHNLSHAAMKYDPYIIGIGAVLYVAHLIYEIIGY